MAKRPLDRGARNFCWSWVMISVVVSFGETLGGGGGGGKGKGKGGRG